MTPALPTHDPSHHSTKSTSKFRSLFGSSLIASGTCLLALLSGCAGSQSTKNLPISITIASDAKVVVEGRHELTNGGKTLTTAYPGSSFHLRVQGKRLDMKASSRTDKLYLDVLKNGERVKKFLFPQGLHTVTLFEDHQIDEPYEIEIIRASAPWQGTLEVFEFQVAGGELLPPAPLPQRKLLFIGDSITSGSVSDPADSTEGKTLAANNGRFSFGRLTARKLNAQSHLVSYGGRGLIRDWEGKDNSQTNNAPVFYPRTFPDDSNSAWDHSRYQADAVIVNLGTNDFAVSIPDAKTFVPAYVDFVQEIRKTQPSAFIFLMLSPMHGMQDRNRAALNDYIKQTIAQLGDDRVAKLGVGYYPGRPVDPHPVKEEHERIAQEIAPVIAKTLGWQ